MDDMIGIEFAFTIAFLIGELTFFKMIEKALIGHDMIGIKGTLHGFDCFLA